MMTVELLLRATILLQIADLWVILTRLWIYHVHGMIYRETGKAMSSTYTWTLTAIFCSYMIYLAILTLRPVFS